MEWTEDGPHGNTYTSEASDSFFKASGLTPGMAYTFKYKKKELLAEWSAESEPVSTSGIYFPFIPSFLPHTFLALKRCIFLFVPPPTAHNSQKFLVRAKSRFFKCRRFLRNFLSLLFLGLVLLPSMCAFGSRWKQLTHFPLSLSIRRPNLLRSSRSRSTSIK